MAYATGTATDISDLITKLFTFATANGWTQDQLSTGTGQAALHLGNTYVSFRWTTSSATILAIYQALGYTGGNQPGTHPNDSGNGFAPGTITNANLDNERHVDLGLGSYPAYYFFTDGTSYLHVVVEKSSTIYRHFGFGLITKFGDWTGGEYCYGQVQTSASMIGSGSEVNTALLTGHCDSTSGTTGTLHLEGLPNEGGSSKWGITWNVGSGSGPPGTDTAGNARVQVQGGHKGGPLATVFGYIPASAATGFVAMTPISLFYVDTVADLVYYLGAMTDVRQLNMREFAPADEVVIGADTWKIFPTSQKTIVSSADRSYNAGIAYKKVP